MPVLQDTICRLADEVSTTGDPEAALRTLRELRAELEVVERARVQEALQGGVSFGALARAMGISRQAAHRRYRDLAPGRTRRLRLSSHARRALLLARAEARAMGAQGVAGEHILLGVLSSGGSVARALNAEGITSEAARACVVPSDDAAAAKELMRSAAAIAEAREAPHIEAEHLLLAALTDPDGGATRAIVALGVTPAAVRERLGC
jgi:ATP-dependent Clp protease ATP-binding subunit ClpA